MNNSMGSLRLPMQAAPVDRTSSPAALSGSGVEASQWQAALGQLAQPLIEEGVKRLGSWVSSWF
jgi:hypothetical protein